MSYQATPAGSSQAVQAPLTEQEAALVVRLFSDPSYFPREFKQWVTDHASDSVDIAKGQVHGLINSSGQLIFTDASWIQLGQVLTGLIVPWASVTPPAANWLRCDGSFYSQATYAQLFTLIGHQHDPYASTGQFAIPDCRGRAIYGFDEVAGSGNLPFAAHDTALVGSRGSSHHHDMGAAHVHNMPHTHNMSHTHGFNQGFYASGGAGGLIGAGTAVQGGSPSVSDTGGPSYSNTAPGGGGNTSGSGLPDGPGWIALNYVIATGNMP